jgi:hypothetical protein
MTPLRRVTVVLLIVFGCLFAALTVPALWTRAIVLNTDRWVDTVGPLSEKPAIQKALTQQIGDRLVEAADLQSVAENVLPARAQQLAPAVAEGGDTLIRNAVNEFVRSDAFGTIWENANRAAHSAAVKLLTGKTRGNVKLSGNDLVVDLGAVFDHVRERLDQRDIHLIDNVSGERLNRQIVIADASKLQKARHAVRVLEKLTIVLPILALLCFAGHVALSRDHRRGLLRCALGLTVTMLLLLAAIAVARSLYLRSLGGEVIPRDAAADVFDAVVSFFDNAARFLAVVGIVVVAGTLLWARRHRLAQAGRSPQTRWIARHHVVLQVVVGLVGAGVLLLWNPLNATVALITLASAAATIAVLALLARGTPVSGAQD